MAWTQIASSQRWTTNSPAIYFDLYYDMYRSGSSMFYKFAINIQPVTGASFFGYNIVLDYSLDYVAKINGILLKNNSPSQWASPIYYESGWYEVPYKTSGTTVGGYRIYSNSGRDVTYYYNQAIVPAGSVLGYIPNFTIDSTEGVGVPFSVPTTKYFSGYYDVLTIKIGSNTVATRLNYLSGNVTFSNAELTTATTGIYDLMYNVGSASFTFELRTYTDSGLGTQIGSTSTAYAQGSLTYAPPILSSSNVTHLDSNATTVALTGSNTKFIQGYSNLQITVDAKATAQKGAILGNNTYIFEVPSETTQYANQSDSLNFVKTFTTIGYNTYNLKVIDSRGAQLTIPKTLTDWTTYSAPAISALSVTRQNGSDADILLEFSGTYTDWTGLSTTNSIQTARFRYKEVGGSYGSYTSITLSTNTGGSFTRTSYNAVDLDISKSYEFEIEVIDRLASTTQTQIVPAGVSLIVLDTTNKLVGINSIPNTGYAEGSLDVGGDIYTGGEQLFPYKVTKNRFFRSFNLSVSASTLTEWNWSSVNDSGNTKIYVSSNRIYLDSSVKMAWLYLNMYTSTTDFNIYVTYPSTETTTSWQSRGGYGYSGTGNMNICVPLLGTGATNDIQIRVFSGSAFTVYYDNYWTFAEVVAFYV